MNSKKNIIVYGEELPKFVISVLWRYLIIIREGNDTPIFTKVFEEWKNYLLNDVKPIVFDKIHLVFIPESTEKHQPHQYMARYFNRVSDTGLIQIEDNTIIYTKFARFFLFAEIEKKGVNFRGTEVYFRQGVTVNLQYIINEQISAYFINRSYQIYDNLNKNTSTKQKNIIDSEIKKNLDKLLEKDLGKILKQDLSAQIEAFEFDRTFLYNCDCCNKSIKEPEGYLLRTFELIQSEKYWRFIFNQMKFGIDEFGLKARLEYFKRILSFEPTWIICENCMEHYFSKNNKSKLYMNEWIAKKGEYEPPKSDDFRNYLTEDDLKKIGYIIVTVE